jgi:hypothetical protein
MNDQIEKQAIEGMAKVIEHTEHIAEEMVGARPSPTMYAKDLYWHGYRKQEWISVDERLPQEFVSVLGYMTDAGDFPPVRECYVVGRAFFFPALGIHPVSHWMPLPEPPKMKGERNENL